MASEKSQRFASISYFSIICGLFSALFEGQFSLKSPLESCEHRCSPLSLHQMLARFLSWAARKMADFLLLLSWIALKCLFVRSSPLLPTGAKSSRSEIEDFSTTYPHSWLKRWRRSETKYWASASSISVLHPHIPSGQMQRRGTEASRLRLLHGIPSPTPFSWTRRLWAHPARENAESSAWFRRSPAPHRSGILKGGSAMAASSVRGGKTYRSGTTQRDLLRLPSLHPSAAQGWGRVQRGRSRR